eukprot:scaffold192691_cov43-Prasinocladus_malaysianus.AAC.2
MQSAKPTQCPKPPAKPPAAPQGASGPASSHQSPDVEVYAPDNIRYTTRDRHVVSTRYQPRLPIELCVRLAFHEDKSPQSQQPPDSE